MMNGENKRRIDAARDVLVGIIPDPKGQVEQITTALIYKYIDELDRESVAADGKRSFFTGKYTKFSWEKLMLPSLDGDQRLVLYRQALESLPQNDKLPKIFREMLRGAHSQFRDARVLGLFMKEIDDLECIYTEDLGDAYEHLLSIMGTQGDAGQFRTPRHIIDFIVAAVNPQIGERILDPACGSAGFLVSAYNHIMEANTNKGKTRLTQAQKRQLPNNIVGRDIDPGMIRLAMVNLYLHGIKKPHAEEYDTLSDDAHWHERYDVVLANPPFMTPRGGIRPHGRFSIRANRSEVLFVDYISEHLSPQGRAGIIVPEGIVFQSGAAYKELRKMLIEEWGLYAVVSLPQGVFYPYSGVQTSVLLLDRTRKNYKNILFVKMENDGFELNAKRMPFDKDDIPHALKILRAWKDNKMTNSLAWAVSKNNIAKSENFSLVGAMYRMSEMTSNTHELVKLSDVVIDMKDGGTPPRKDKTNFNGDINWAVVKDISPQIYSTMETLSEKGLKNSSAKVWPVNSVIISLGATIGKVGIAKIPLATKQGLSGIVVNTEKILPEFLYYILCSQREFIQSLATGVSIKEVRPSKLLKILNIPLPSLVEQQRIVSEIENYDKVRNGARAVVENWEPSINIAPDWKRVKLSDIGKVTKGSTITKQSAKHGEIPVIAGGRKPAYFHNQANRKGPTITIGGSGNAGYVNFFDMPIYASDCVTIQIHDNKTNIYFLYALLKTMQEKIYTLRSGMAQPHVYAKDIANLQVPCPSLAMQDKIASGLLSEFRLVSQGHVLITAMDKRIAAVIKKIWNA